MNTETLHQMVNITDAIANIVLIIVVLYYIVPRKVLAKFFEIKHKYAVGQVVTVIYNDELLNGLVGKIAEVKRHGFWPFGVPYYRFHAVGNLWVSEKIVYQATAQQAMDYSNWEKEEELKQFKNQ